MSYSTTLRSASLAGVAAAGLVYSSILSHGLAVGATTESNAAARDAAAVVMHTGTTPTMPASGTIDAGGPTSFSFTASNRVGAATGPGDCAGPNCSQFVLMVGNPGGQNVRIRLDWQFVANDYDLYVFAVSGTSETQVASSGNGTTTFEEAIFTPTSSTTYHVVIVHFAAAVPDNITGSASLASPPSVTDASRIGPTGTGIVFSRNGNIQTGAGEAPTGKGTVFAKETVRDGEPSIRADVLGNVYPAGIRGVPAGVDVWRYGPNAYCPLFTFHDEAEFADGQDPADGYVWLGQPDGIFPGGQGSPDAGGGDIEIAVSFPRSFTPTLTHPPTLSMVSLTLANITAAASTNRGNDWSPVNPVAAVAPVDDRQWIEAYGDNTVYLYYRTLTTLTGLVLDKSINGGVSYGAGATLVNPLGFTPGWIDVDQSPNSNGSVDIYLSGQNSSELAVFHCVDLNPDGVSTITCTRATVDNTMSHGHLFDVVNVDKADNVYVAWSNNQDIFYAYSTDKAATWSSPVKVTNAGGGGGMPNFNFFPWITAGDNGRLGIVWYGTDKTTNGDNDAEWKAYYAFTDNARATPPTIRWLPASDHFIHKSNVSQAGFSSDNAVNRNLIDFFQVAHDPRDGAAVIAFADDHNDFDGGTYYTRQIAGPGMRASVNPTQPASCPALTPLRNPEVLDFRDDVTTVSGTKLVMPDADILNLDYSSEQVGPDLFLKADIVVDQLLVQPVERSYRAYFAVNTARGLMDTGNEYFLEVTTESGTPQFFLGAKDRRIDGTTDERRITVGENIAPDQPTTTFELGAPGVVHLRVKADRLNYSFTANGPAPVKGGSSAPTTGALVIGLSGRARTATPAATALVDQTRGGSFIILGQEDGVVVTGEVECTDPAVTQFGGWHDWTADGQGRKGGQETYCRHVGQRGQSSASQRPFMELRFPGNARQVRYDYFKNQRGSIVEVLIDGASMGTIDQFVANGDQSGHQNLVSANMTYAVTPRVDPHTIRVVHRTDQATDSRNIAYIDGFVVTQGAMGAAASRDAEIAFTGSVAAGKTAEHVIIAGLRTLAVNAVVEPTLTSLFTSDALSVEIYNPAGIRIESSTQVLAPETVTAPTVVPGNYTIKVRNNTTRTVQYRASMIKTQGR